MLKELKVLSYWNLNILEVSGTTSIGKLKVLSYWNLNGISISVIFADVNLKVLSYWNLNNYIDIYVVNGLDLKYYHIGI